MSDLSLPLSPALPDPSAQTADYPAADHASCSPLEESITLDRDGLLLAMGKGVERMMGFAAPLQPGLLLGRSCSDRAFVDAVAFGTAAQAPHRTMLVRQGLDGKLRHVLMKVVPVGPAPLPVLVLLSDATRQVQREDDLLAACRVLDGISEAVLLVDMANFRVRQANAAALIMLGLDSGELPSLQFDQLCARLRAEDGSTPTLAQLAAQINPSEYDCRRADGSALNVEVRVERMRLARRDLLSVVIRDVSQRVQALAQLRAASSRCAITFSQAATGLAHVSIDGRWIKVNHKLTSIVAYSEQELLSIPAREITHPQDRASDVMVYQRMLAGELMYSTREKRLRRKDGSHAWVSVTSSIAYDEQGAPSHYICMIEDIDERKRADERMRHLALHDVLTGLPNRAGLHGYLGQALEAAARAGGRLGIVFLDMDKLKSINDTHGHEEGDRALVGFAQHLQQVVRSGDLVARLGGDEFVIVLNDVSRRADIDATLQRTLLARPPAGASCSIGVSIFPDDGRDAQTLIRHADLAMYRAKQRGGSAYAYYSAMPEGDASFPAMQPIPLE
ncbi:diguanylate cyclase domain-containing protein [Telluria aromaticivorans]|uniref:Diguanylate cyclase n=1 Tax=Telluria aromaticivorans TaxID=2725995 RepID=A0A7Y2JVV3_9BURK|nr:diguanylate cyclase [Telluria aromaticivorans]NNG21638.1 diguanylate cyclase [Telluria aromaticivorans]